MSFKPVIYKLMTSKETYGTRPASKSTYEVINLNDVRSFVSPVLYNEVKDIWSIEIRYKDNKKYSAYFETQTKANMFFHKLCDTVHMPVKEIQPWLNDVKADRAKEDIDG